MFTVAKAILEVLTVLQELNVIVLKTAAVKLAQKVNDLGIRFVRFPRNNECAA